MKKKTLIITLASVALITLTTVGLLIYGTIQGISFLLQQAGPQVQTLQAQGLPDQVTGLFNQLKKTIQTPECRSAISKVTNIEVWIQGAGENLIPQIGLACLGSYFNSAPIENLEAQEVENEII